MSVFKKILGSQAREAVKAAGDVVDRLSVSDEEKSQAKAEIAQVVQESLLGVARMQANVIGNEMAGNWLQKSWRPLVMMAFTILLIIRWTGISAHPIDLELEKQLMELLQFGMGGYIAGRSIEKVADRVTKNIDLSFLKKKDREDYFR